MAQSGLGDFEVDDVSDEELNVVNSERKKLAAFVSSLTMDDIKSGGWFAKLCAQSLSTYTARVNAQYFKDKYPGVPAAALVDQRIKMASRYAALEGGLSAGAYTATIAATIGTLGGASAATVPAAIGTMMIDVAFVTQLQLRLAYDISVLYRVPLDLDDPDDVWKLIRVAFTIKGGEFAKDGLVKGAPILVRPLIKRFYSRSVLSAAKGLPFVGKFLLQRNVIKIGLPLVGVPLAVVLNRYTTLIAGRHAETVFRDEARIIELVERITQQSKHPALLPWVSWLMLMADDKISDDEALFIRHLVRLLSELHSIVDEQFAQIVDIEPEDVWTRIDSESGDFSDIIDTAYKVAEVDAPMNPRERAVIAELRKRTI